MEKCDILGLDINVTNMEDTVMFINENLDDLKGNYICVSNVHTTVMAYEDKNYKLVQNSGAMRLPDGKPLSTVSRMKGFKDAQRVTGPDLMEEIFKISEEKNYTHYFYGSTEDTLCKLEKKLKIKYPNLKIAGMYSPPFRKLTEEEDIRIVEGINKVNPNFVWVGLGAPKQEIWMYEHKTRINSLMIGVGAGFDYHSENIKRAPKWMQKYSLEWLYRLMQDPKRLFRRYIETNIKFIFYILKSK